jgi:D-serine deaminase-like pyridoxal phosphate-dependent protein
VSHPAPRFFTIDCGSKAIAADPAGVRGVIADWGDCAEPVTQSEEHWSFRMKDTGQKRPGVGSVVYVIPTHICPTSALYPSAVVVNNGKITGSWEVTARNRIIKI